MATNNYTTHTDREKPISRKLLKYLCLIDKRGSELYRRADPSEHHTIEVIDVALIHALDFTRKRHDELPVAITHVHNYWRKHDIKPVLSKPLEELVADRYIATEKKRKRQVQWINGRRLSRLKTPPDERQAAIIKRYLRDYPGFKSFSDDFPGLSAQEIAAATGLTYVRVRQLLSG